MSVNQRLYIFFCSFLVFVAGNEVISDEDYELSNTFANIGNAYFKNRSLTAALTYYKKAIDLNYFHVPAMVNLGVVYVEQENLQKGEQYFHQASERTLASHFSIRTGRQVSPYAMI